MAKNLEYLCSESGNYASYERIFLRGIGSGSGNLVGDGLNFICVFGKMMDGEGGVVWFNDGIRNHW